MPSSRRCAGGAGGEKSSRVTHSSPVLSERGPPAAAIGLGQEDLIFCSACPASAGRRAPDGCPVSNCLSASRERTLFELMHHGFQLFQGGIKTQTVDFFWPCPSSGLEKRLILTSTGHRGGRKVRRPQTIPPPADKNWLISPHLRAPIGDRACCQGVIAENSAQYK